MCPSFPIHISIHFNQVIHLLSSSENGNNEIDEVFSCGQTSLGKQMQGIQTGELGAKNVHCGLSEPEGVHLKWF